MPEKIAGSGQRLCYLASPLVRVAAVFALAVLAVPAVPVVRPVSGAGPEEYCPALVSDLAYTHNSNL